MRSAAQVESSQIRKHDPPTQNDTVEKLEPFPLNGEISPFKRAFATGIILMTYARLRFSDAQRLRILEADAGSVHGALLRSKTKKPHGIPRSWTFPHMGVSGSTEWATPVIEFRVTREKLNGSTPSFAFPCLNHRWGLEKAEPAAYASTRRKLALVCDGANGPGGETYTLRPPPRTSHRPRKRK